jgi:hypothetical protein
MMMMVMMVMMMVMVMMMAMVMMMYLEFVVGRDFHAESTYRVLRSDTPV